MFLEIARNMTTAYKLYIGGKWINSSSNKTFESINPANGEILGSFQSANPFDVKRAVDAAWKAYYGWSSLPAPKRGLILLEIARLLRKNKQMLGKLVTMEMGKVLPEALGDVQEAIDTFEYMAGEGRRLFGHTTTSELPNKFAMTVRRPEGVCGLISPWNFPLAIPSWKLAPALVCGNTVILKPSSDTPLCAIELVKILNKAGVPPGVVNLLTGNGSGVGKEIVQNDMIRCLSFTGSKETGEWIKKNSGLKKIGMEMGGKNPIIIMDDADLILALDGVIWGAFGTTGQRCTAASRVIVHKDIKDRFTNLLVKRVKKLRLGDGLDPSTEIGPLINKAALEKTSRYVEIGKREGAKLITGGRPVKGKGFFYQPTIFTGVKSRMRIAQEEIFGPVLSVLEAKDLKDAIRIANDVDYGLSSAVYTNDISRAFETLDSIESGLTYINSSTIGSEVHLPFGGVKGTGHTREAGIEGIDEFSHSKVVYIDYSGKLQKAQIDE